MPSPSPVKPRCSSVVAFTLTASTEQGRKHRPCSGRMAGICGASLGALTQQQWRRCCSISTAGCIQQDLANLRQASFRLSAPAYSRVGIREMLADIPQRRRAQHVHPITAWASTSASEWPSRPFSYGIVHAAQNQLAALHQAVNIITMTNAHCIFSLILCRGGAGPLAW